MKKTILLTLTLCTVILNTSAFAAERKMYGEMLCSGEITNNLSGFDCYKVKGKDTWENLFPDENARDVVKRFNRINMSLHSGWTLAIPKNLSNLTLFDVSPFPLNQDPTGQKNIIVDLNKLAWAAYDAEGNLVIWGPASGGRGWCPDISRPCRTQTGNYTFYEKKDYDCISNKFPPPNGGAAMPYCMHYYRAFALHGSFEVPGFNDSHGCIRMFITDARWLNEKFVDFDTKVEVLPY